MAGTASPHQLPPFVSVAASLRAITEHLADELASPQRAAPDWSEFEWRIARAVAAVHGISGLLAARCGGTGWKGRRIFAEPQNLARGARANAAALTIAQLTRGASPDTLSTPGTLHRS